MRWATMQQVRELLPEKGTPQGTGRITSRDRDPAASPPRRPRTLTVQPHRVLVPCGPRVSGRRVRVTPATS
jgi:hypothetical protein